MEPFTDKFDCYVCPGDTIVAHVDGFTLRATLYHDNDAGEPWDREDGHGPVSEWTNRDKAPNERILSTDHSSHRYYDFQEACAIARRDGWGVIGGKQPGETDRAYAARAAEHDYKVLKAWCDDEWHYYGLAVTVEKAGISLTGDYDHALWGIEGNYPDSDNAYFTEVANDLADEALGAAKASISELCACEAA